VVFCVFAAFLLFSTRGVWTQNDCSQIDYTRQGAKFDTVTRRSLRVVCKYRRGAFSLRKRQNFALCAIVSVFGAVNDKRQPGTGTPRRIGQRERRAAFPFGGATRQCAARSVDNVSGNQPGTQAQLFVMNQRTKKRRAALLPRGVSKRWLPLTANMKIGMVVATVGDYCNAFQ